VTPGPGGGLWNLQEKGPETFGIIVTTTAMGKDGDKYNSVAACSKICTELPHCDAFSHYAHDSCYLYSLKTVDKKYDGDIATAPYNDGECYIKSDV
jgi:hypothetical protein